MRPSNSSCSTTIVHVSLPPSDYDDGLATSGPTAVVHNNNNNCGSSSIGSVRRSAPMVVDSSTVESGNSPSRNHQLNRSETDNGEKSRWVSTTTVCEQSSAAPEAVQQQQQSEAADGYYTARTSVVSLMPPAPSDGLGGAAATMKPKMMMVGLCGGGGGSETITIIPETRDNHRTTQSATEITVLGAENASTPSSQQSSGSSCGELCRICHGEGSDETPLIAPCCCSGSMKYVHQECIQMWLKSSGSLSCELCRFTYLTGTKLEPLRQWKRLDLTLLERWKIVCCVMIQLFAICYFILSVEALVRAIKDFHVPQAAMWLWIKIVMSIFGITVSLACTVRQCKTFFRLFRRWQMYNRTIFVKDRSQCLDTPSASRALLGRSK